MSDSTQVTTTTQDVVTTTPKATTPKAKATTRKPVAFSSIHVAFGKAKGVDVTKAAKLNRSYIRNNFDAIARVWPELRKSQKENRDGNRYPTMIPAHVADMIVKRNVPTGKK
jgi:hypothetical protein